MSKNTYTLLVVTGCAALSMVGANLSMNYWQLPTFNFNLANVSQTGLDNSVKPTFPLVDLPRSVRGEEALALLGDKIPEIARWYGISAEELETRFKTDKALVADKKGRLLYEDSADFFINPIPNSNLSNTGILPLEQTFNLHSRPGAPRTMYLDFDGYFFKNGANVWVTSDFNAPPFDIDGNPGTFNDAERQIIQGVWLRMAEDFAPYNVNVTTEEPTADKLQRSSTSDIYFGNTVLFTPASGVLRPGAGGSSYVGIFDDTSDFYKPTLVFPENLGNSEKYMGEIGSHEAGHSLGLPHKGTTGGEEYYFGQGDWAPLMGGGLYRNVTQWSKGEYASANNKTDDLQTMLSYGVSYVADDFGNSISGAGNAVVSGNSISAAGIIEKNTDVDFIKFNSGAGSLTINANVAPIGSNLDIVLTLYDANGRVLVSENPYGLPASISTTIPAGTYYISIKGTGAGDPLIDGYSNYASLGQYYIDGTIVGTNNNPPIAVVSGNPTGGSVPLTVQFSSTGSSDPDGGPLTYFWNFGDGTNSTEPNPQKTYTETGTYTVTLTVTDSTNLSGSSSLVISTVNQAPVAFFTLNTASYNVPSTVNVDASGSSDIDGTITSYSWNFGNGVTATGVNANHTYTTTGTYPITLTVTDNGGLSTTRTTSITIVDPNQINAPTKLSGSTGGRIKSGITLKWIDNSSNETHFHIERAIQQSTPVYQKVAEVGANATTYIDSVSKGTYYYRVRAFNSSNGKYSGYSNAIQVRLR